MTFTTAISYFVPEKYKNDKELNRKSRFIVWFSYATIVVTVFFSTYFYIQRPNDTFNILIGASIPLFLVIVLFQFRKKGSFIFTTHIICSFFIVAMAILPNSTGGLFSPDTPTVYILPLFALIMGNARIGIFYSVITIGVFIVYYIAALSHSELYHTQLNSLPSDYFLFNLVFNLVLLLFLVFRNENLRQKLLGELKDINQIISEKSKEITDSINYAKRIQSAILPERAIVRKHFPQSLLLYLPKDIVSGDFYWIAEKNGFQFLAVADCTGHGVPGALMSVIGVNQLNTIVQEKNISEPSEILEELNEGVNKILKQNQTEVNDGMDIALLRINLQDKTIEYAGANRSLYYVRGGQLHEIKATKSSIGGVDPGKGKKFASGHLKLQAGDMVYVSTDGYPDQFGSAKNKKITTKKFKSLLASIAEKELATQEQHLLDSFNSHKAGYEQTDDVLVMGLRF